MTELLRVDLNCDLGEGGSHDEVLLTLATSANIACGLHAGDPSLAHRTVQLTAAAGAGLGAHPGLPDREGMGRRDAPVSPEEAFDLVVYQVGALAAFAALGGWKLEHVKPHGALYNRAAREPELARALAEAVKAFDPRLALFALAGSELVRAGRAAGLAVAEEAFPDRGYAPDGTLLPRSAPGALVESPEEVAERGLAMVMEGRVATADGTELRLHADTLCVHGDGPTALPALRCLRHALERTGAAVRRFGAT
jgi:UPF0271 protein